MNNSFMKRMVYEIKIYESQKEFFNNSGIYMEYDTNDLTKIKLLIIGPENTPYANGFYFFNIYISTNYPFTPPKFKFMNNIDNIRFHPNFYVDGYVCLSVLNTWGKNEWSPCQNLISIASTIQSVMNENPITNEPEFETETGTISQNYYKIIEYYNLKGSVYKILKSQFDNNNTNTNNFKQIIKDYFLSNYDKYMKIITKNKRELDNETISCQIYELSVKLEYKNLEKYFKETHQSLSFIEGKED
jgi:ubiquitin-protein ligase